MSFSQSTPAFRVSFANTRPGTGIRVWVAMGLVALGGALFALALFHGFENGSCSSTGYSANYGPVARCGPGVGWWMLILFIGLAAGGAGAALSATARRIASPALFIAIGAPFLVLALRSGNVQLVQNTSSSTGKLYAGVFGACFLIAGAAWGVIAGGRALSHLSGGNRLGSLLAAILGVAVAFAITAGVAGAIGTASPPSTPRVSGGGNYSNPAVTQAQRQVARARKLAACVSAAGSDVAKIQKCQAKYGS